MDFTIKKYGQLLDALKNNGYYFQTFEELINKPKEKVVVLRHDVDRKPKNSLVMALAENKFGIESSYYFRIGKESNKPNIIKQIARLGHEIGYHYEDLANAKGNLKKAIKDFEKNLEYFRTFYPIKTICMHGSPLSKWDNKGLWKKYDYHNYGIIAEPYFDLNFDKLFYITDASRSWNNENITLRDKVKTRFHFDIKSTQDIIELINSDKAPDKIMINTHPQNWTDKKLEWYKILLWQNFKNLVKRILVIVRSKKV